LDVSLNGVRVENPLILELAEGVLPLSREHDFLSALTFGTAPPRLSSVPERVPYGYYL